VYKNVKKTCSKDNMCLNKGHTDIVAYKGVFIYFCIHGGENLFDDGILRCASVTLAVALLHPTGELGGPDSSAAGETLEDIQSLWDLRNSARSWGRRPGACSV
jgi:hypothetical protein